MPIVWSQQGHPMEDCAPKAQGEWYTVSLVQYTRAEAGGPILATTSQPVATFLAHEEAVHYATALAKYGACDLVRIT